MTFNITNCINIIYDQLNLLNTTNENESNHIDFFVDITNLNICRPKDYDNLLSNYPPSPIWLISRNRKLFIITICIILINQY